MFMGMGMPIPDLSNLPGPSRPGYPSGDVGSYDFKFEVTGAVTIKANANAAGTFTVTWPDGTTQALSGDNASVVAPNATAGTVSINKQSDATFCDEFAIVSGQANVSEVKSWGENPWYSLDSAFLNCTNLTDISKTVFTSGVGGVNGCVLNYIFKGCTALESADISNWDFTNPISIQEGFMNCTGLNSFKASSLNIKTLSTRWLSNVGTATTDGCDFQMSGLNITTTSSYASGQMVDWFRSCKIKPSSNFSNWSFPSIAHYPMSFTFATITGTNSTLNCSGWTNYNSTSFPSFQVVKPTAGGNSNMKIDITGLNVSTVTSLFRGFQGCWASEIIGLSGLGATNSATAAEYFMYQNFYLKFTNHNFSSAFMNSLAPTNAVAMFTEVGKNLSLADAGPPPNLHNLDLSATTNIGAIFRQTKFSTAPDFTNVTLSPTTVYNTGSMFQNMQVNDNSNVNSLFSKTFKMDSLSGLIGSTNMDSVIFGSGIDFSSVTTMAYAFSGTPNTTNVEFPTNANFSSLTTASNAFTNHTLSTCQVDNLIRAFYNTALTNAVTITFGSAKITESPAVVQSLETELVSNGWSITTNSTDATLPFAYPTYSFDSDQVQSTTPSTLPPVADRNFTSNNANVTVNQTTGVVTWDSGFAGSVNIRCTYADGCYNEVNFSITAAVELIDNNFAMEFDSSSNNYLIANPNTLGINTAISISAWVKTSINTGYGAIINEDDASGKRNWNLLRKNDDVFFTIFHDATGTNKEVITTTTVNVSDGEWHHVVGTWDGTTSANSMKVYFDGTEVAQATPSSTGINTEAVGPWIGNSSDLSSGNNQFNGDIDEVAVWSRALEATDVQTIYNATNNNPGKCANLWSGGLGTGLVYWNRMGD